MVTEFSSYQKQPILSYEKLNSDKIFIGSIIRSRYDENRICINDKFDPKRLDHAGLFLYGSILEPFGKYRKCIKEFDKIKSIDLYSYNKILMKYSLSCEENFAYLENGLHPIDAKHIQELIPNFKYDLFFLEEEETPIYQRIKCANLFILRPNFDC
jgi:hypothetical protein